MIRSILLALLILPLVSVAQIYKSTDERGTVTFSDTAPEGAAVERVELRETNTTPPPPERPAPPPAPAAEGEEEASYQVTIVQPANDTTIPMGPGNFGVSASVEPALAEGLLLQLYLDGDPRGEPQPGNSWQLTNVFRGAHDLGVAVIGAGGERLAEAQTVRVYVLRPSVNFRD